MKDEQAGLRYRRSFWVIHVTPARMGIEGRRGGSVIRCRFEPLQPISASIRPIRGPSFQKSALAPTRRIGYTEGCRCRVTLPGAGCRVSRSSQKLRRSMGGAQHSIEQVASFGRRWAAAVHRALHVVRTSIQYVGVDLCGLSVFCERECSVRPSDVGLFGALEIVLEGDSITNLVEEYFGLGGASAGARLRHKVFSFQCRI
jgi:hypothetical protein